MGDSCSWCHFVIPVERVAPKNAGRTFAQTIFATCDIQLSQLPPKVFNGDTVGIKITEEEYESHSKNARGRRKVA